MVADFGIARMLDQGIDNLTATGMIFGTPSYMSPEQATGDRELDGRSDTYSLGCVLYEMVVGHPPFMGQTARELMARHAMDPVPPAQSGRATVRDELEAALATALAKDPVDRFPSAGAFAAELDRIRRLGPAPARSVTTGRSTGSRSASSPARRRWLVWAAAGAVAAVAVGAAWLATTRSGATGPTRVAVLPLRSLGLEDAELFAEGLTEEITFRLAKLRDLAVVARNNTISLAGGRTVADVGRELNCDYLVTGTIRWHEERGSRQVRVLTSLIRVSDGLSIGDAEFTGAVSDVFTLQSEVAQRVAEALPVRLGSVERGALGRPASVSADAYREYSVGRSLWRRRTPADLVAAVERFEAALRIDSTFARAYSGLSDSYVLYKQFGVAALPPQVAWARAKQAAERALALDSTLAEAHASLGEVLFYSDWDIATAEGRFRRAIAPDPSYATAHQWLAELLALVGRGREATAAARRAVELDPVSPAASNALSMALQAAERPREAIAQSARTMALLASSGGLAGDPGRQLLMGYALYGSAMSHLALGEYQDAVRIMAQLGDTTALTRSWMRAYVEPGYRPEARRLVAQSEARLAALPPTIQSYATAAVGDLDRTIALLGRVVREDGPIATGVMIVPFFREFRRDPKFRAMLDRFGFPR
ncbi:MAG: hypothetical protein FJ206_02710 [Gemmatimonadetes bacterium]|nr:hypothetical protein [Gemmatimonadota bacterium]